MEFVQFGLPLFTYQFATTKNCMQLQAYIGTLMYISQLQVFLFKNQKVDKKWKLFIKIQEKIHVLVKHNFCL